MKILFSLIELELHLNEIIGFIEQLNEVDTDSVSPLSSVTGHNLPIREDVVNDGNKNNDVLENAPEKKSGYFVVPKVCLLYTSDAADEP